MEKKEIQLTDESTYPDETILKAILGETYDAYRGLRDLLNYYEMNHEWRYYKDGKGWLCKVRKKKKTIVWMSAWNGYMKAAVYIPTRLMDKVYALDISDETKERIRQTTDAGKSKPCIFEIRNRGVLVELNVVMQFKMKAK